MSKCIKCGIHTLQKKSTEKTLSGYEYTLHYEHCIPCNREYVSTENIIINDKNVRKAKAEQCPIIYIDMDDTICDYTSKYNELLEETGIKYPQSQYGFYTSLELKKDALVAMDLFKKHILKGRHEVYILTAPSIKNPLSYTEKTVWVEQHLGEFWVERLIISPNKSLLLGDVLIDDSAEGRGQENFKGNLIHFGSKKYKNWNEVMRYFR